MKPLGQLVAHKNKKSKSRLLTFKEYCQYVYEPSKTIKALNLPEEERLELERIIRERLEYRVH